MFTNDYNVVFGNDTDKERLLVVEVDDIRFISGISGNLTSFSVVFFRCYLLISGSLD